MTLAYRIFFNICRLKLLARGKIRVKKMTILNAAGQDYHMSTGFPAS